MGAAEDIYVMAWETRPGFEAVTITDQAHTFAQDKAHCQEKKIIIMGEEGDLSIYTAKCHLVV